MPVMRDDFTEGIKKDMYGYFFEAYDPVPVLYPNIFQEEDSTGAYEKDTSVIGVGEISRKLEGEALTAHKIGEGYSTYGGNRTYGDELIISYETVQDHQKIKDILHKAAAGWGQKMKEAKDGFFANIFNYGGLTAGHDIFNASVAGPNGFVDPTGNGIYDGKSDAVSPLFARNGSGKSHLSYVGQTAYYNGVALALTPANFQQVYLAITSTNNKDERDGLISIKPDTLLVPPALKFTAQVILESERVPGSAQNDKNVLANIVSLVVWDRLSDPDAWFLVKAKMGLVCQNRQEPVIDFYQDEHTKDYVANVIARWGLRINNWRGVYGSNYSEA